jgi:dTDP-4-amino-4,6-dideoxygalactose transaminase
MGVDRDSVRRQLEDAGIATGVYYPVPLHRQPPYECEAVENYPEAERAAADMISIPVHPALTDADLEQVVGAFSRLSVRSGREDLPFVG